jgi:hypothetical protein
MSTFFLDIRFADNPDTPGGDRLCETMPKVGEGFFWYDPIARTTSLFQIVKVSHYSTETGEIPVINKSRGVIWLRRVVSGISGARRDGHE